MNLETSTKRKSVEQEVKTKMKAMREERNGYVNIRSVLCELVFIVSVQQLM
jgi:hypothetical protein